MVKKGEKGEKVTSHIQSGLLTNDTSDHLPIFQMTDIGINGKKNNFAFNKKRILTDRFIYLKLLVDLRRQNGMKF